MSWHKIDNFNYIAFIAMMTARAHISTMRMCKHSLYIYISDVLVNNSLSFICCCTFFFFVLFPFIKQSTAQQHSRSRQWRRNDQSYRMKGKDAHTAQSRTPQTGRMPFKMTINKCMVNLRYHRLWIIIPVAKFYKWIYCIGAMRVSVYIQSSCWRLTLAGSIACCCPNTSQRDTFTIWTTHDAMRCVVAVGAVA